MNDSPPPVPPLKIKHYPRAIFRFSLFFIHAGLMFGLYKFRCLLKRGQPQPCIEIRKRMFTQWAKRTLRFLGVSLHIEGALPPSPALIASNHLGYLDILILIAIFPTRFLSKIEVAGWPFLGPMVKDMGTLFIDRSSRRDIPVVLKKMKDVLDMNESLVFFPEGTSHNGTMILPLRSPLLKMPVTERLDLYPVGIKYKTIHPDFPAIRDVCWWGNMPFMSHFFRFCAIPTLEASIHFGPPLPPGDNRKELSKKLHQALADLTQ